MLSINQFLAWNKLIPFNNYQLLKTVNRHVAAASDGGGLTLRPLRGTWAPSPSRFGHMENKAIL